jgi:hypothetical protein
MAKRARSSLEQQLAALPRWAAVALACRCARRIQPLFAAGWPRVTTQRAARVDRAIQAAESAAAKGGTAIIPRSAGNSANSVVHQASEAEEKGQAHSVASVAASAATYAALAAAEKNVSTRSSWISNAVGCGHVYPAGPQLAKALDAEINCDLKRLLQAARQQGWTDETAVSLDFLGPLWAKGEPPVWHALLGKLQKPSFAVAKKEKKEKRTTKKPPVGALQYDPDSFAGPLDRSLVAKVGKSLGHRFDPAYVRHLVQHHGGQPGKRYFPTSNNVKVIERFLCMLADPSKNKKHGWFDVGVVADQLEDRLGGDENPDLVPFAALFAGDFLCFDYRHGEPPRVVVWDHECSRRGRPRTEEVAANFTEFLELLTSEESE